MLRRAVALWPLTVAGMHMDPYVALELLSEFDEFLLPQMRHMFTQYRNLLFVPQQHVPSIERNVKASTRNIVHQELHCVERAPQTLRGAHAVCFVFCLARTPAYVELTGSAATASRLESL